MAEDSVSLPEEAQPDLKRQKMSTTATSDDEENQENNPAVPTKPRYKRRKIAIFFAYCGVGYQGMQKNPGAKTIEGDLEEALYLSGAIPEAERGQHKRFDWARSARTDKGVSAVGQVVSGKFYIDPPGFVERLNSNLSPQIRIFGYKRTTASFSAKKFCDRRRYVYLIPVFALDPSCHRDRESVNASKGTGNDLVKCVECSERGRKVFGVMGKRNAESKTVSDSSGVFSNTRGKIDKSSSSDSEKTQNSKPGDNQTVEPHPAISSDNVGEKEMVIDSLETGNSSAETEKLSENEPVDPSKGNVVLGEQEITINCETGKVSEIELGDDKNANGDERLDNRKSDFCYGEAEKERFNKILKHYEGTHNFHNFTTRTTAWDPAANRYIISFNANTVVNVEGIDFVKCEVVGQSFMLHQIRKMIGLAVAIMRNCAPESILATAFEQKVNINVPTAPEVGLYLDECFFSSYNKKWMDTHEEVSMKAYAEEAEEFKMKYIYPHIASAEKNDGAVGLWLHSLNYRNYPDLLGEGNAQSSDARENEANDCSTASLKQGDRDTENTDE